MNLQANGLSDKPDPKDQTIQNFLNDPGFPIAAGKNLKAITAGVKKGYQEHGTKLKHAVNASAQGKSYTKHVAKSSALVGDSDEDDEADRAGGASDDDVAGSARVRGGARLRGQEDEEEDVEDAELVPRIARRKRAVASDDSDVRASSRSWV